MPVTPGPGAYSPKNNLTPIKTEQLYKVEQSPRAYPSPHTQNDMDFKANGRQLKTNNSRVELTQKRVVGKNAPPKLVNNRPRALPSIPSQSIAPPEDLAEAFAGSPRKPDIKQPYFVQPIELDGARELGYLTILQKATNLNVGPGSYDPAVLPVKNPHAAVDWSLQADRFVVETKDVYEGDPYYQ